MNGRVMGNVISALRAALQGPLPGHAGFLAMANWPTEAIEEARRKDPAPRESAVMVLLHGTGDALSTTLILRPEYDGVHSGQVAFPGGRKEPGDADLLATAVREMHEEIGVTAEGLDQLGALSQLYIPPSRSLVTPIVAHKAAAPTYTPDAREVATVFDVPLTALLDPQALGYAERYIPVARMNASVPCFTLSGQVVWGATAMMLWELRELLMRLRQA